VTWQHLAAQDRKIAGLERAISERAFSANTSAPRRIVGSEEHGAVMIFEGRGGGQPGAVGIRDEDGLFVVTVYKFAVYDEGTRQFGLTLESEWAQGSAEDIRALARMLAGAVDGH